MFCSKCGNSNSASPEIITRNLKVGDQIEFGSYEQDNDTDNGAEPILWDVIGQNNGRYLLISHYVLDYMAYEKDNTTGRNTAMA